MIETKRICEICMKDKELFLNVCTRSGNKQIMLKLPSTREIFPNEAVSSILKNSACILDAYQLLLTNEGISKEMDQHEDIGMSDVVQAAEESIAIITQALEILQEGR